MFKTIAVAMETCIFIFSGTLPVYCVKVLLYCFSERLVHEDVHASISFWVDFNLSTSK